MEEEDEGPGGNVEKTTGAHPQRWMWSDVETPAEPKGVWREVEAEIQRGRVFGEGRPIPKKILKKTGSATSDLFPPSRYGLEPENRCFLCKNFLDSKDCDNWKRVEPALTVVDGKEKYRVRTTPGWNQCGVTGLRWVSFCEAELEYCLEDWDQFSTFLEKERFTPCGPLIDIRVISGELTSVHLPHFLCSVWDYRNDVKLLHSEDSGVSLEKCLLLSFHVIPICDTFPPQGVVVSSKFNVKAHCDMLIYRTSAAHLTLHVYLVPSHPYMKEFVVKREKDSVQILKLTPCYPLQLGDDYTLRTSCPSHITPQKLKFTYTNKTLNGFEVFIRDAKEDFFLELFNNTHTSEWGTIIQTARVSAHPESSPPDSKHPESSPPDPKHPESSPPDPKHPESSPPDPKHPESSPPDPKHPESSPPDPKHPESSPPDPKHPESSPPDPKHPESSPPDPKHPESSPPDSKHPESSPPDSKHPESSPPEPKHPESSPPDSKHPESSPPEPKHPESSPPDFTAFTGSLEAHDDDINMIMDDELETTQKQFAKLSASAGAPSVRSSQRRSISFCQLCSSLQETTEWKRIDPKDDENLHYRVSSAAGRYECSASGLRWVCDGDVSLKYHFADWDLYGEDLRRMQFEPCGPLMDITVISGVLTEAHLPHVACLGSSPDSLRDEVRVLHVQDGGMFLENCELTRFHAKLLHPTFSPKGFLIRSGFPVKVHCEVLIYQILTAHLTLHVYLVMCDQNIIQKVENNEKDAVKIPKPGPERSLPMKSRYTIETRKEEKHFSSTIKPERLKLRYSPIKYCEVYIRNAEDDFELHLISERNESVWDVGVRAEEYRRSSSFTSSGGQKTPSMDYAVWFVSNHRTELIQRVRLVTPIADDLKRFIGDEKYSIITACKTPQEQMRALYEFLCGVERLEKRFYKILLKHDPHLVEDLTEAD